MRESINWNIKFNDLILLQTAERFINGFEKTGRLFVIIPNLKDVICIYSFIFSIPLIVSNILQRKKEQALVVECRGHDAARFHSIEHAHG